MPPDSPDSWDHVRNATHFAPVCPQFIPDLSNASNALKFMSSGRRSYLQKLFPLLRRQDEDCLYLNIYTPSTLNGAYRRLPVVVLIHGESFEWDSGNAYDGSVLAAYNSLIFVTLNFRLGILGFLR